MGGTFSWKCVLQGTQSLSAILDIFDDYFLILPTFSSHHRHPSSFDHKSRFKRHFLGRDYFFGNKHLPFTRKLRVSSNQKTFGCLPFPKQLRTSFIWNKKRDWIIFTKKNEVLFHICVVVMVVFLVIKLINLDNNIWTNNCLICIVYEPPMKQLSHL